MIPPLHPQAGGEKEQLPAAEGGADSSPEDDEPPPSSSSDGRRVYYSPDFMMALASCSAATRKMEAKDLLSLESYAIDLLLDEPRPFDGLFAGACGGGSGSEDWQVQIEGWGATLGPDRGGAAALGPDEAAGREAEGRSPGTAAR